MCKSNIDHTNIKYLIKPDTVLTSLKEFLKLDGVNIFGNGIIVLNLEKSAWINKLKKKFLIRKSNKPRDIKNSFRCKTKVLIGYNQIFTVFVSFKIDLAVK
jgi:hypothetical protein